MVVQVSQSINVSPIVYRITLTEDGKWYKLEEAEISAPSIKLYFNYAQQTFTLSLKGEVELNISKKGKFEQPYLTPKHVDEVKNYGFVNLWRVIEAVTPIHTNEREVVEDMLWALEALIKATH